MTDVDGGAIGDERRLQIAYFVSRFPHVSETFIVRELNELEGRAGVEIELFSLFPAVDRTVHSAATRWLPKLHVPKTGAALAGLAWWLRRRPASLVTAVVSVARAYYRRPGVLVRALATVPLAAAHARTVQRLGIQHVHAHWATYPALAAWVCHRLTGVTYSFTAHAHDLYVHRLHLADKIREASFVVTISEFNRRLLESIPEAQTPIHVVHAGIDVRSYPYVPRTPPPTGVVHALCVASLQDYKGHIYLLEALSLGSPDVDRIELELIGDGSLRAELEGAAKRLGVAERVTFRGSCTEDEVREALGRADAFVLPSAVAKDGLVEGLPVALMEALAAGAPVVTTRVSGVPELVRHEETGLLADPNDSASLLEQLRRLLQDPEAARARTAAGRRLVEEEFDLRRTSAQLLALFEGSSARSRAAG